MSAAGSGVCSAHIHWALQTLLTSCVTFNSLTKQGRLAGHTEAKAVTDSHIKVSHSEEKVSSFYQKRNVWILY